MDGIRNSGEVDTHSIFFFFYRNISNISSAHRAHTTFTVFAKHLFLMDSSLELMVSVKGIENGFGLGSRLRCDAYHNFKFTLCETYVNNVVPNRIIVHHRWHQCDMTVDSVFRMQCGTYLQPIKMPDISISIPTRRTKSVRFRSKRYFWIIFLWTVSRVKTNEKKMVLMDQANSSDWHAQTHARSVVERDANNLFEKCKNSLSLSSACEFSAQRNCDSSQWQNAFR